MKLSGRIKDQHFQFSSITEVLAKASEEKSGDIMSKVAAESSLERVAAKWILSELTLKDIFEHPVIPYETDEVTRVIYDQINQHIYNEVAHWTVGYLREYILDHSTKSSDLKRISRGLTSEMISAVAKIMSSIDLVMASQKIRYEAHCNTTIGEPGRLAFRCQPNHPTDQTEGILASLKEGLDKALKD